MSNIFSLGLKRNLLTYVDNAHKTRPDCPDQRSRLSLADALLRRTANL